MSVSEESEMIHRKRMIIIDGNNVAYGHLNGKMFSVKGLELCINYFKKLGHEVTAVVPQFKLKKHQSTDYVLLEKLHRQGDVTLAPCKSLPGQFSSSYDDRLILSIAEQFDGVIISNDNYRDLLDISPEWRRIIETRVVGYSWVKDCFFLPDDPYGRYGPTLQQILNGQSC
uniref:RNase_Zc3h12a domain-containing protein n=1 Tax=Anopheles epiroticus TaxID=199890 RepID=A0A182P3N1_9DIPT